jgi:hypothetical protein
MRELGLFLVFAELLFNCPNERAQYDFLLLAALLPFLTLPVTAVLSFEPGLAARYAFTPFLVIPAPFLVGR